MEQKDTQERSTGYQVVARRYRPVAFEQLIGQEHVARALSNAIQTNRVGHAYLFTGARGVGKTSSARIFAKALDCVHGPTPSPCNECEICRGITSGEDIDVLEIDGASNRGIDQIQFLRQNASIRPSRARYKIYIIDEVHMLTKEAFNALLKTLEEPPEHVKFIFCTTEPTKIPITILSRCQRFDFVAIDAAAIAKRLAQIAEQEGTKVEPGVCELLARRANGSMRDAQSLLEQLLAFASEHITAADVHAVLGTIDDRKLLELATAMARGEMNIVLQLLDAAGSQGVDFSVLIEQMMGLFRDLMVVASECPASAMLYATVGSFDEVKKLALALGLDRIMASLQILDQTYQRLRYSTQGRILSELALARLCTLNRFTQIAQVLDMLQKGTIPTEALAGLKPAKSPARLPAAEPDKPDEKKKSDALTSVPSASVPSASDEYPVAPDVPAHIPSNVVGPVSEPVESQNEVEPDACEPDIEPDIPESATQEPQRNERPRHAFDSTTDAQASELWRQLIGETKAPALSSQMRACTQVHLKKPNVFILEFPADFRASLEYCRNSKARIAETLQTYFDVPIAVDFALSAERRNPEPTVSAPITAHSRGELYQEADSHPIIQRLKELFDADLADVSQ